MQRYTELPIILESMNNSFVQSSKKIYAGLGRRFWAYAIDWFIVFFLCVLIDKIVIIDYFDGFGFYEIDLALIILYWVLLESSSYQATIGKYALK